MARRFSAPYQSEPVSSLANWARNLAVFAVVAVVVSILIVRFGFLEMKPALATFFGALGCAVLSILVGLAAFAAIWQNGSRGMGRILLAFLISTLLLAYPAYLALQYRKLPPIHDITTDPIDPPRFEALAGLRTGDGTNTAVYAGLYSAEQQRDRKSTRLNSSHMSISYAVFCLKKKINTISPTFPVNSQRSVDE